MKKVIICCLIFFSSIILSNSSFAQTTTPAPTKTSPTSIEDSTQIERIKDLVASKVAELKLVEKRGVLGTVQQTTSTQITILDLKNSRRIIDIDEITQFSDPDNDTFGISDIKKGDLIGIVGLLNKGSEHILARFVNTVSSVPTLFDGVITAIDRRNFTITAVDESGNKRTIDVETSTKISTFTKDDDMVKSGFSKIETGQRIFVSGYPDSRTASQLNADAIIVFPELALSSKLKKFAEEETVVVTPTTIRRTATVTPRPTVRATVTP